MSERQNPVAGWLVRPDRRVGVPGFRLTDHPKRPPIYGIRRRRPTGRSGFASAPIIAPLEIHPIPSRAWGLSLANLASRPSWNRVRCRLGAAPDRACSVCGSIAGLHAHEVWDFIRPERGGWGRQVLVALLAVCPTCHDIFHPGRHRSHGRSGDPLWRLMDLNGWNQREADLHGRWTSWSFAARANTLWVLDVRLARFADLEFPSAMGSWSEGPVLNVNGRRVPIST